ncbi:pre-mRNA-splicing factor CWC21-like [Stegodyphus dumicola]|uniref:pre-mRNA-splicing factor CWC21-like n=1 Tax=Stegodyphus dumicola TaxID=202533 RepID=UPI0015AFA120|nr:pre-mRNA-splicing factor CWC21-like [Stegodyphus dumicola]
MSSKSSSHYSQLPRSRTRTRTPKSSSRMQTLSPKSSSRLQSPKSSSRIKSLKSSSRIQNPKSSSRMQTVSPKNNRRSRSSNPRSARKTRPRSAKSRSKSPKGAHLLNPGNFAGKKGPVPFTIWKKHDSYEPGTSPSRIVTRSQTGFNRVKKTDSNTALFGDEKKFVVPNCPHLSLIMKGRHGALPATIVTRSSGKYYSKDDKLEGRLTWYKTGKGRDASEAREDFEFSLRTDEGDDEYMCSIQ